MMPKYTVEEWKEITKDFLLEQNAKVNAAHGAQIDSETYICQSNVARLHSYLKIALFVCFCLFVFDRRASRNGGFFVIN
jgi:hypothetical protein